MHPLSAQAPRTVVESAVPPTSTQPSIKSENVRSVILDPKDDVLVLDDIKVGMGILYHPEFRIRIHRIHMFLGLLDPDPDPSVRGMDSAPDPDPSVIMQK